MRCKVRRRRPSALREISGAALALVLATVLCCGSSLALASRPYYALLGNAASFRGYLNDEYSQVITGLSSSSSMGYNRSWRWLDPASAGSASASAALSPSWAGIAARALAQFGRAPSALLVLIKFHWNYDAVARLGPIARRRCHFFSTTTIFAYVDDLHWYDGPNKRTHEAALDEVDVVLATYAYNLKVLYPGLSTSRPRQQLHRIKQVAWVPHATTAQMFRAIVRDSRRRPFSSSSSSSSPSSGKVLLSGAVDREWYPYRHMVKRWLQKKNPGDPRFFQLNHPGYPKEIDGAGKEQSKASAVIGRNYASTLAQHAACLTDGLHLDYVVAKMLEFPAAGCLMLVNAEMRSKLAKMGLFDGAHFLTYRDTRMLGDLVDWVLDTRNTNAIAGIRRRAQRVVWRRHIVAHRSALIDAVLLRVITIDALGLK